MVGRNDLAGWLPDAMLSTTSTHLKALDSFPREVKEKMLMQRRLFNRLDWWLPQDWFSTEVFWGTGSSQIDAALLVVPVSMTPDAPAFSSKDQCAWIRWCSVADDVSASAVLRDLFECSRLAMLAIGVHRVYCIVEPVHWLMPYMLDSGYKPVDAIITMVNRERTGDEPATHQTAQPFIRMALESDLKRLRSVDCAAFEEQWQYPEFVLRKALKSSIYFSVAELDSTVVGYQFAVCNERDAHITRLAVHPHYQGLGIGRQILEDAIGTLRRDFGISTISLNTQASNTASQNLYLRCGFTTLHPVLRVMCADFSAR